MVVAAAGRGAVVAVPTITLADDLMGVVLTPLAGVVVASGSTR